MADTHKKHKSSKKVKKSVSSAPASATATPAPSSPATLLAPPPVPASVSAGSSRPDSPTPSERGLQLSDMVSIKAVSSGAYLRLFVDKRKSMTLEFNPLRSKHRRCKSEQFMASWDYAHGSHHDHKPHEEEKPPSADQEAAMIRLRELRSKLQKQDTLDKDILEMEDSDADEEIENPNSHTRKRSHSTGGAMSGIMQRVNSLSKSLKRNISVEKKDKDAIKDKTSGKESLTSSLKEKEKDKDKKKDKEKDKDKRDSVKEGTLPKLSLTEPNSPALAVTPRKSIDAGGRPRLNSTSEKSSKHTRKASNDKDLEPGTPSKHSRKSSNDSNHGDGDKSKHRRKPSREQEADSAAAATPAPEPPSDRVVDQKLVRQRSLGSINFSSSSLIKGASPTSPQTKFNKQMRRGMSQVLIQHKEEELVFETDPDGSKLLAAGTVPQLVAMLAVRIQDYSLLRSFLLCKGHFITSTGLLKLLIDLYDRVSNSSTEAQQQSYIQMRVVNLIKKWLNFNIVDFKKSQELCDMLTAQAKKMRKTTNEKETGWADLLQNSFESALNYAELIEEKFRGINVEGSPKSLLSKKILQLETDFDILNAHDPTKKNPRLSFDVMDLDPEELARQMTIFDQEMTRKVEFLELLNKNFEKPDRSPNIQKLQARFNEISGWIGTEIVTASNMRLRAKMIEYFIHLCHKLFGLQNFFSFFAVGAGLAQLPVSRLKQTWRKVSAARMEKWKKYEQVINPIGNFRELRQYHDNAIPPLIPTPTLFLKDLVFIQDGNEDWYDEKRKLVSWTKIKLLGKVISRIQSALEVPYKLKRVEVIQQYLHHLYLFTPDDLEVQAKKLERLAEV